jgi:hypothetical protein
MREMGAENTTSGIEKGMKHPNCSPIRAPEMIAEATMAACQGHRFVSIRSGT